MFCGSHCTGLQGLLLSAAVLLVVCNQSSAAPVPQDFVQNFSSSFDILRNPELLASAKTFQQLLQHKHSLSRGSLQRSLVYKGANLRLRRVLNKLQTVGQQVTIGVIGGSVSWGHMVKKDVEDWFTLFTSWINSTFPAAKLKFKNGCVPATQSEYVSMCLNQFVDPDVDLIFVEYATNDGYTPGSIDNAPVRAFERLLRKLLQFKGDPAVCLMEFMATDAKQKQLPFYATAEDAYGVLAQYYGLPWLSYRNVVWHGLMSDQPGFSRYEIFPAEEERHPTPLGHKYMADIAINLIQQTYMDSILAPLDATLLEQHPLAQVPPPMFPGNRESSNLVCLIGDELRSVVVQHTGNWTWVNDGTAAKPKWGYASWDIGATLVLRVDTRAMVYAINNTRGNASLISGGGSASSSSLGMHTAASGRRTHEARLDDTSVPGMPNSSTAGSTDSSSSTGQLLAAAVAEAAAAADQEPVPSSIASGVPDMIIWVGYLKSWRNMGSATLSCIQGCQCQSVLVDAMHFEDNTQQHMAKLFATQAEECLVAVQINAWAQTSEHRFKVTGIMVSHRIDYNAQGDFTETLLLDSMHMGN